MSTLPEDLPLTPSDARELAKSLGLDHEESEDCEGWPRFGHGFTNSKGELHYCHIVIGPMDRVQIVALEGK